MILTESCRQRQGVLIRLEISPGSSSSHSAVVNTSHVMLFGGYQRNSLTSKPRLALNLTNAIICIYLAWAGAVFTYSLTAASPSLGLATYPPYATGPAARGRSCALRLYLCIQLMVFASRIQDSQGLSSQTAHHLSCMEA